MHRTITTTTRIARRAATTPIAILTPLLRPAPPLVSGSSRDSSVIVGLSESLNADKILVCGCWKKKRGILYLMRSSEKEKVEELTGEHQAVSLQNCDLICILQENESYAEHAPQAKTLDV